MSSSGAIKIDDVKERERLIRLSNLPLAALDVNTQKIAGRGRAYVEYLKSPVYAEDLTDNRLGVHLYGNDAATRSQLFLLTAKGLALNERPVWFCSALYLCRTLESSDDERIKKLGTVGNLFIENFEVKFGDGGCPFTYYQRLLMEEFLSSRQRSGLVTNYSTSVNWPELTWWSSDFLSSQAASIRNFSI